MLGYAHCSWRILWPASCVFNPPWLQGTHAQLVLKVFVLVVPDPEPPKKKHRKKVSPTPPFQRLPRRLWQSPYRGYKNPRTGDMEAIFFPGESPTNMGLGCLVPFSPQPIRLDMRIWGWQRDHV